MPAFALEVVTPERVAYSGQVASLQAPGSEGSFGVLAGHIPLLTSLQIGRLRFVEEDGNEVQMAISGGFVEVGREQVAVLAETAERIEEIDVERARVFAPARRGTPRPSARRTRGDRRSAGAGGVGARHQSPPHVRVNFYRITCKAKALAIAFASVFCMGQWLATRCSERRAPYGPDRRMPMPRGPLIR